jgi:hypothetical protein
VIFEFNNLEQFLNQMMVEGLLTLVLQIRKSS